MTVLENGIFRFLVAVVGFLPAASYSYVLAPFTTSQSVVQCPSIVVDEAAITADGVDRLYEMSVNCNVKRNITGPPWNWEESTLVGEVRATYSTDTQAARWRAEYSAQSSDGFHSGLVSLDYRCTVDPFFDDGVPNQCVFLGLSDTGNLFTHVDSTVPGKDSVHPGMLVTKSAEAPPPPPDTNHPLTDKLGEAVASNPTLTSNRIRIVSPLQNEVVTEEKVLFQVDESSLKNADGEWRFKEEECCLLELQYKAFPDKSLNISFKWVTVALKEYLDHGEDLAEGRNRDRSKLADWATETLEGTDLGSQSVLAALDSGGKANGEWRWRARVVSRDGANYGSLWRDFRIADQQEAQSKIRLKSGQQIRQ